MIHGSSGKSTVIWYNRSCTCSVSENSRLHTRHISSKACKDFGSEYSGECCCSCDDIGNIHSRKSCCSRSSDSLYDFIGSFVSDVSFIVYLVGKIGLFVYDEVCSRSEKIGTTGVVEDE